MIKLAKRKGEAYIMKRMVSTKIWRNNILAVTAWSGSAKFSIGIGVSKHFPQILSKVKT